MDRLFQAWRDTPRPYKAAAIGIAFVLIMLVSGGTSQIRSYFERRAFQRERDSLKAVITEKSAAADASQKRAEDAEAEKAKYQTAFELAGKSAADALRKVEDAEKKFDDEVRAIDAPVSDCERYNRVRAKLQLPAVNCE